MSRSREQDERAIQALRVKTARLARTTAKQRKSQLKTLDAIHKSFGEDSIRTFAQKVPALPCISTGNRDLDDFFTGQTALDEDGKQYTIPGSGRGLPKGRIIEVYGPESSGKTTLMLEIIAGFQAQGYRCGVVDVEHALDPTYAQRLGVDLPETWFSQPDSAEQALEIVNRLVETSALDLIVVDSVAALTPLAEQEGEMGDSHMGLHARLMGQALRKITALLNKQSSTIVVFINQIRLKIGILYGNPETTPGGNALRFYASMRVDIRRTQQLKHKQQPIGQRSRLKLVKSKVSVPFREVYVDITQGRGITATHRTISKNRK